MLVVVMLLLMALLLRHLIEQWLVEASELASYLAARYRLLGS